MYNGILGLEIPVDTMSSAFSIAYDIVAITIARTTGLAELKLNQVMSCASGWLDEHGFQMATQKTEIVVLTKKWIVTRLLITVLGDVIITKEAVRYLGITLDIFLYGVRSGPMH